MTAGRTCSSTDTDQSGRVWACGKVDCNGLSHVYRVKTAADSSLGTLVEALSTPLETVTTAQVEAARAVCPPDLRDMLLIDDEGIVEGIARGLWTEVPA